MRAQFPHIPNVSVEPFMLKSQLYSSVKDRTQVDRELESKKVNPKESNPYLKNDGSGYPEENDGVKVGANQLLSSSIVGDGGASWRLNALKRAQEQASREGRSFQELWEKGRVLLVS